MFFTLPELLGQLWLNAFTGDRECSPAGLRLVSLKPLTRPPSLPLPTVRNFHKYFFWSYRRFARPRDVLRFIGTEMTKLDNEELAGTYGQHKCVTTISSPPTRALRLQLTSSRPLSPQVVLHPRLVDRQPPARLCGRGHPGGVRRPLQRD